MLLEILSGNFTTILIGLVVFLLVMFGLHSRKRERMNFPPGPVPLPVVGNLLHLAIGDPLTNFRKLRAKYGDVFSLFFGKQLVIVINGFEALHDSLVKQGDVLSGRSRRHTDAADVSPEVKANGIILANAGPIWTRNRRFAISTLRDFGMGRNKLQIKIHEEIENMLREIDKREGKPFDPRTIIATSVSNVICSIVFGKRYDYDDEEFKEILNLMQSIMANAGLTGFLSQLPIIGKMSFVNKKPRTVVDCTAKLYEHFRHIVENCEETYDEGNVRSLIDAFIKEKRATADFPEGYGPDYELGRIILDLFMAGTETTSTALLWGIAYAVNDPKFQQTLYKEIDNNVEDLPKMEHKLRLPNVEASTYEILRHADIAPFSIPHVVTKATIFRNYNIPEGSMVFPILDSSLKDPDVWEDPFTFNHRRFLGGNSVTTSEHFTPFGLGKRMCAGESLARMELFLFWSALIQNFEFLPAEEGKPPSLNGTLKITHAPRPYEVIAIRRDKHRK